jgi:hypothetical protein
MLLDDLKVARAQLELTVHAYVHRYGSRTVDEEREPKEHVMS